MRMGTIMEVCNDLEAEDNSSLLCLLSSFVIQDTLSDTDQQGHADYIESRVARHDAEPSGVISRSAVIDSFKVPTSDVHGQLSRGSLTFISQYGLIVPVPHTLTSASMARVFVIASPTFVTVRQELPFLITFFPWDATSELSWF